jgi:spermidine dehydrogenase
MRDRITRRDFLNGVAYWAAGGAAAYAAGAARALADDYPPALTGFRGSRFEDLRTAHAVRDGAQYASARYPVDESVEYVVIGAGISGLSAAYFLEARAPGARVLILDNHDDFGGHARRNEFNVDGRLLIGYGGSETIQAPNASWTPTSRKLLSDLGVQLSRFEQAFDWRLYPGLGMSFGQLFRREVFGVDRLVTGDPQRPLPTDIPAELHRGRPIMEFAADCPLSYAQRQRLIDLYSATRNLFPGTSIQEKRRLLSKISYAEFLTSYWDIDATLLQMFRGRTLDLFALPAELVSASDCADDGFPGFQGLGLEPSDENLEPYIYHFPDGNASIARLLVRRLIPAVAPGHSMDDIVTAPFDYGRLDEPRSPVRLRLSSTAVKLENAGPHVDVVYVTGERVRRVRCRHAIYAGYESMLPHICAELPKPQTALLAANVKMPLVYVTVALRNWRPWVRAGVHSIGNPTGFYSSMKLDYPVSLGAYRFSASPDEPILMHLVHVPQPPTPIADCRASLRAARTILYSRPFADFEAALRDETTRALGAAGFDAERDIAAITVNRWGHGYAFDSNPVSDPHAPPDLITASRRPVGRISIAGSDAAWNAIAHSAIDEGHRAAAEALRTPRAAARA